MTRRAHNVNAVRELVLETVPQLGVAETQMCRETNWTRPGFFHGRRFDFASVRAVWFVEEEQVKFYRSDRKLLKVLRLDAAEQRGE